MKKFMNFLKRHSKKLAVISAVSFAALSVGAVMSWGPDRTTFTVANPASYVTFNSIVDNPHVGDEREFVSVKAVDGNYNSGWKDEITVEPGKEYLVRIYAHNNAAENLNLIAKNTTVSAGVPTTTGKMVPISGFVSADNAQPQKVWDDIRLKSDVDFNLAYVAGSARIFNNGYASNAEGQPLPDSIVTASGAKIGYTAPNGDVPGCFQYDNFVYFKVKPQFAAQPDYAIEKEVRVKGETSWAKNVKANPGDEVEWRMQFKNTGQTQLNNVAIVDETPKNTTTVPGSVEIFDANRPNGYKFGPEAIQGKLINLMIGNYGANSNAWIYYNSKIDSKEKLECGTNKLVNKVYATPAEMPTIEDDATVEVEKKCEEMPPVYECTALKAENLGSNKYRFTTTVKAENGATVNKYIYNFGDNTVALNTDKSVVEHQYAKPGKYDVEVRVLFNIGNEQKEARCTTNVVIPTVPTTPETPEVPVTEIPKTGAGEIVAGLFGTSATAYGAYAWVASRRALKNIR